MKKITGFFKNTDKIILSIVAMILTIVLLNIYHIYSVSKTIGGTVGSAIGDSAGKLIGSYNGYINGYQEGEEEAKKHRFDITWQDSISQIGKLEVLEIDLNYLDVYKSNDSLDPNYAEVFSEDVRVSFTVDLSSIRVNDNEKQLVIVVPEPVCSKPTQIKNSYKQYETYGKNVDAGSTTAGLDQETRNHNQLMNTIEENIKNVYSEEAKKSAEKQIKDIVKAMSGKDAVIKFE